MTGNHLGVAGAALSLLPVLTPLACLSDEGHVEPDMTVPVISGLPEGDHHIDHVETRLPGLHLHVERMAVFDMGQFHIGGMASNIHAEIGESLHADLDGLRLFAKEADFLVERETGHLAGMHVAQLQIGCGTSTLCQGHHEDVERKTILELRNLEVFTTGYSVEAGNGQGQRLEIIASGTMMPSRVTRADGHDQQESSVNGNDTGIKFRMRVGMGVNDLAVALEVPPWAGEPDLSVMLADLAMKLGGERLVSKLVASGMTDHAGHGGVLHVAHTHSSDSD